MYLETEKRVKRKRPADATLCYVDGPLERERRILQEFVDIHSLAGYLYDNKNSVKKQEKPGAQQMLSSREVLVRDVTQDS